MPEIPDGLRKYFRELGQAGGLKSWEKRKASMTTEERSEHMRKMREARAKKAAAKAAAAAKKAKKRAPRAGK